MDVTSPFETEIARLRQAGVPGTAGRLRDLFDWLATRGPDAPSATQAEIALGVFGEESADADDATVRVYIHRLRKKIDDHYAGQVASQTEGAARIELPAGTYALRLANPGAQAPAPQRQSQTGLGTWQLPVWLWLALAAGIIAAVFGAQNFIASGQPNALWQPLLASDRPVLVVLGDYYIYGEIDPFRPEEGRLIRDFRVNSAQDLYALQEAEPERYARAEDQGLNYLPMSSAYALQQVAPILADAGKDVEVIAASALDAGMLSRYDIVYIGLFSGMGLLEDVNFANSSFRIGESYDELRDLTNASTYTSGEARSLATPAFYRDYGYVARSRAPGGGELIVLAGSRDTGLRGITTLATGPNLPDALAKIAAGEFEALAQVTGQQGADLNTRLVVSHKRDAPDSSATIH